MKVAGTGRILLWNGGSLWIGRAGAPTGVHAHHAVQLSCALPGEVRLRAEDGDWVGARAVLVAANVAHAFAADGALVANVFVEPESRLGQALHLLCRERGLVALDAAAFDAELRALFTAYGGKADDGGLIASAQALVERLAATARGQGPALDPRIGNALAHIRAHIGDASIPLASVAAAAYLSPDRFRHLFLTQTGMRFRPYVQWLRLEVALAAYAGHRNLTEAAQAAGFADSAHFSRTFRNMFGVAPSSIRID